MAAGRTCDNCGCTTSEDEQMYSIRIEMFARADPLVLEPEDLLDDHLAKIEDLVKQMETLDAEEASDEVHESYTFDLCGPCRRLIHQQLKLKAKLKK
jgi:hypothetical protein